MCDKTSVLISKCRAFVTKVVEDTVKGVPETIGIIEVIRVYASPPAYH